MFLGKGRRTASFLSFLTFATFVSFVSVVSVISFVSFVSLLTFVSFVSFVTFVSIPKERVAAELKLYVSNSPEDKKKSLREKLLKVSHYSRLKNI